MKEVIDELREVARENEIPLDFYNKMVMEASLYVRDNNLSDQDLYKIMDLAIQCYDPKYELPEVMKDKRKYARQTVAIAINKLYDKFYYGDEEEKHSRRFN